MTGQPILSSEIAYPGRDSRVGLHHVELVMGMAVSIDVRDAYTPPEAITEVVDWLHHVDATFSPYIHDSPITAIGRGELQICNASAEIREVLATCEEVRDATGGAFDVFAVPAPNGTSFDPSGLVKGWSIERAAEILERWNCGNFCLNAGGDIALRGHPDNDDSWRVGIRHPELDFGLACVVEARGRCAVATSATYERGAHIIDPRSHQPTTELASVTVMGPDLTYADAYATSLFVMGRAGLEWLAELPDYEAYIITHDAMTFWTPGFAQYKSPNSAALN